MAEHQTVYLSERNPKEDVANYWGDLKNRIPAIKQLRWARLCAEMAAVYKENPKDMDHWLKEVLDNKEAALLAGEPEAEILRATFTSLLPDEFRESREQRTLPPIKKLSPPRKRKRPTFVEATTDTAAPAGFADKAVQTYAHGEFDVLTLEDMQTPKTKRKVIDFTTSQPVVVAGDSDDEEIAPPQTDRSGATSRAGSIPRKEYEKLKVTCPPMSDCEGTYVLQPDTVNGQPWWAFESTSGTTWKLYSSPRGMWTITKGPTGDFKTGRGLVAAGSYHDGKMPYMDNDSPWQCAQFGMWRQHAGISVDSLCSADISKLVIQKFGSNGYLKKRALSRLIRHSLNDPYMPPVSDETYAKFCKEMKADPSKGIPAEALAAWFTSTGIAQQLSQTQTTSGSSGVAQSGSSLVATNLSTATNVSEPAAPTPSATAQKPSRGFAARCGECKACRNPRWKKSCENPPKRSHSAPSSDPISSYSDEDGEGESDDAVAKLLGMRIMARPQEARPPRANRAGYAVGVPLRRQGSSQ
eukprot:TRINITY_DN22841_c0_g1_i2.p1 TRINITY_DN22841_c0_g1~~TRINITY_DN22841_c0_g1_i2.p1  ORF type:complete len:525 (+),score=128.41 TRINITY_DN22841_c0_g1_i2:62-1636(+)